MHHHAGMLHLIRMFVLPSSHDDRRAGHAEASRQTSLYKQRGGPPPHPSDPEASWWSGRIARGGVGPGSFPRELNGACLTVELGPGVGMDRESKISGKGDSVLPRRPHAQPGHTQPGPKGPKSLTHRRRLRQRQAIYNHRDIHLYTDGHDTRTDDHSLHRRCPPRPRIHQPPARQPTQAT
jgi:hypothetical protein